MKKVSIVGLLLLLQSGVTWTVVYPRDLFAVAQMRVDSVRQPQGLDWYLQSRQAKDILTSVAAYMGVDPVYVRLALEIKPTGRAEGEETFYIVPVPAGYVFCAVRIGVRSLVPATVIGRIG